MDGNKRLIGPTSIEKPTARTDALTRRRPALTDHLLTDALLSLHVSLGVRIETDRLRVLREDLRGMHFTREELAAVVRWLKADAYLDEKVRYGGKITPADFARARQHAIPPHLRVEHVWKRQGVPVPGPVELEPDPYGDDYDGPVLDLAALPPAPDERLREASSVGALLDPSSSSRSPEKTPNEHDDPDASRCDRHGRVLVEGKYCAECDVEDALRLRRAKR